MNTWHNPPVEPVPNAGSPGPVWVAMTTPGLGNANDTGQVAPPWIIGATVAVKLAGLKAPPQPAPGAVTPSGTGTDGS
jgi:hypothetical protein